MTKIRLSIAVVLALSFLWPIAPVNQASAADIFSQCSASSSGTTTCGPCNTSNGQTAGSTLCKEAKTAQGSTQNPAVHTIRIATTIIALIAGVAAVVMIILGGLALIGSAGNSENIALARRRIIYSIVGLVVIALAWTLVQFITDHIG